MRFHSFPILCTKVPWTHEDTTNVELGVRNVRKQFRKDAKVQTTIYHSVVAFHYISTQMLKLVWVQAQRRNTKRWGARLHVTCASWKEKYIQSVKKEGPSSADFFWDRIRIRSLEQIDPQVPVHEGRSVSNLQSTTRETWGKHTSTSFLCVGGAKGRTFLEDIVMVTRLPGHYAKEVPVGTLIWHTSCKKFCWLAPNIPVVV